MKMTLHEVFNKINALSIDGNEHLIVIDPEGNVLGEELGGKDSVYCGNIDFVKGGTIVHNHPVGVSLSLPDLCVASGAGCKIFALTVDGSEYWSHGFVKSLEESEGPYKALMEDETEKMTELVFFAHAHPWMSFDGHMADRIFTHWLNTRMSEVGLIDYGARLKGESADFFAAFLNVQRAYNYREAA